MKGLFVGSLIPAMLPFMTAFAVALAIHRGAATTVDLMWAAPFAAICAAGYIVYGFVVARWRLPR